MKSVSGYDLTRLFVGSEGTLGVATEILLRLLPLPEAVRTAAAFYRDMEGAAESVSRILKARILLKADQAEGGPGWLDGEVVEALDTNLTMVSRVREKLVTEGLDAVLTRKKRETPPVPAIFDGEAQAKLTALACSEPPPGHARWTIRLLAEHVIARQIVPAAHFNTVGRALKKTTSNRT